MREGSHVGSSEGSRLGEKEGKEVVGFNEGRCEGSHVGLYDGADGAKDGLVVGNCEGYNEGEVVGLTEERLFEG